MSKIICEICGTAYPDTAESCPICGYSQDLGLDEMVEEDIQVDVPITPKAKAPRADAAGKKNREIFDYDEVNPDEEMEDEEDSYDEEDEEEEEKESRSNPILVVILVILIVLLLAAAGFIFFKFFLPNMDGGDETLPAVTTTAPEVTETEEATTEAPTIPCTKLALVGGLDVLAVEGQNFLLDVQVMPEDTTDKLIFISEDESVVTVDENGKITVVGEGKTVINVICGQEQFACPVTVDYSMATEATEEGTLPEVDATGDGEEATGAATEETVDTSGVVLKLKQEDIMLMVPYSFQMELDCDLKPEDVEWSVEHDYILSVDETGYITALRSGTTAVIAKFGNQQVQCIVRCYVG